jgi:Bacterial regulatory proteins, gntR family
MYATLIPAAACGIELSWSSGITSRGTRVRNAGHGGGLPVPGMSPWHASVVGQRAKPECVERSTRELIESVQLGPGGRLPSERQLVEQLDAGRTTIRLVLMKLAAEVPSAGLSVPGAVIDCTTRKVVGWPVDDNYRTPLITAARQNVSGRRTDVLRCRTRKWLLVR